MMISPSTVGGVLKSLTYLAFAMIGPKPKSFGWNPTIDPLRPFLAYANALITHNGNRHQKVLQPSG